MHAAQIIAWLRALAWVTIAVVALWLLTKIQFTMATFGLAAALSYLLYPAVNWIFTHGIALVGRQLSWSSSVIIVYLTLPVLLGLTLWVSVPALTGQIETMSQNLPHQMDRLQRAVTYWQGRFDRVHLPQAVRDQMQALVTQSLNRFADFMGNLVGHVANGLLSTLTMMLFFLVALIISNLILLTLPESTRQIYDAVPERFRADIKQLTYDVNVVFGGFIKGTVILSTLASVAVFGLLSGLGLLSWLGVPGMVTFQYALLLALATLVLYPIPILGLIGLAAIGGLAAYVQEGTSAVYVVSVISILVGTVVSVDRLVGPRVMSHAMGVSPLFVMFSAFAGAELFGFWGMIVGVPMAAAIKVLFRYVRLRFLQPEGAELNVASMMGAAPTLHPLTESLAFKGADHLHTVVKAASPSLPSALADATAAPPAPAPATPAVSP